jgi:hypothetical protein
MRLPQHTPVLARPGEHGEVEVQVGLEPLAILAGLTLEERAFVASLEGGRAVTPAQRRRFAAVVGQLSDAGAWWEPASPPPVVALCGCGAVGLAIAAALGAAGCGVELDDPAPVAVEPAGTYGPDAEGTCAAAAAHRLRGLGVRARIGVATAACTVLVSAAAPDPRAVRAVMDAGRPHVLVCADSRGAWVSHVVRTGLTACARCRDLALAAADPCWPYVALQLAGSGLASRRPSAPGFALPVLAGIVASRVGAWLWSGDAGVAQSVSPWGEIIDSPLAPQRACGCGAAGPVGDEVAARRARFSR